MPIKADIVENGQRINFTCSGEFTAQEIINAKRSLMADTETARKVTTFLVSLVEVSAFEVDASEIRTLAEVDRRLSQLIPRAAVAVVAPNDHDYGMARMWETITDIPGWTRHVFRTLPEAEAWLQQFRGK
jgi:hypothetical protein